MSALKAQAREDAAYLDSVKAASAERAERLAGVSAVLKEEVRPMHFDLCHACVVVHHRQSLPGDRWGPCVPPG